MQWRINNGETLFVDSLTADVDEVHIVEEEETTFLHLKATLALIPSGFSPSPSASAFSESSLAFSESSLSLLPVSSGMASGTSAASYFFVSRTADSEAEDSLTVLWGGGGLGGLGFLGLSSSFASDSLASLDFLLDLLRLFDLRST